MVKALDSPVRRRPRGARRGARSSRCTRSTSSCSPSSGATGGGGAGCRTCTSARAIRERRLRDGRQDVQGPHRRAARAGRPSAFLRARRSARDGHIVYVRPELVVEIALDGVQVSTRYPGGVALRFARVRRYRHDKTAAEADTIDTVRAAPSLSSRLIRRAAGRIGRTTDRQLRASHSVTAATVAETVHGPGGSGPWAGRRGGAVRGLGGCRVALSAVALTPDEVAIRVSEPHPLVGVDAGGPAVAVGDPVVPPAQERHLVEVGGSAVFPVGHVVGVAPPNRRVTARRTCSRRRGSRGPCSGRGSRGGPGRPWPTAHPTNRRSTR